MTYRCCATGHVSPLLDCRRLVLDTRRMSVALDGRPVRLSPLGYRLVDYLAHHDDRAISAGELADHLYDASESGDTNAVEAVVLRLRRKLGAEPARLRLPAGRAHMNPSPR